MLTQLNIKFLLFILSITLVYAACRNSGRDSDISQAATMDNAIADNFYSDVFMIVHSNSLNNAIVNGTGITPAKTIDSCAVITLTLFNGGFPAHMIIDYGTGTICADGRQRSGKIIAKYSANYSTTLSTTTVTFSDYWVDSLNLSGKQTIRNRGQINGKKTYSIDVINGLITGDTTRIFYDTNRNYTQISGESTATISTDDAFSISGTANGRTTQGNSFTIEIIEAPIFTASCKYITQGKIKIRPKNLSTRVFDFGDGTCDSKGTLTRNGEMIDITML